MPTVDMTDTRHAVISDIMIGRPKEACFGPEPYKDTFVPARSPTCTHSFPR